MATRQTKLVIKNNTVPNAPFSGATLLKGEAIVNTADGILMFSGVTSSTSNWTPAGLGGNASFFEVGSNLYDLKIRNKITSYGGASLVGQFLSGTTDGFVLAPISSIVGVDTYVTGFSYTDNVITLSQTVNGPTKTVLFNEMTGLTVNGTFSATTSNIGTENVNTLNATGATITTSNVTTENVNTLNATGATITTLGSTTINVDTLNATGATITTSNVTTENVNTLNATGATITTSNVTTENVNTLNATGATITTLDSTTINVNTLNATGATITTSNVTTENVNTLNATGATITTSNVTTENVNTLNATGATITTLGSTTINNIISTSSICSNTTTSSI